MDIFSIVFIAFGLAMDCFAISISKGICVRKFYISQTLLMAFLFGIFQGIMPLISFFAGIRFANTIERIDHWVALVLLGFIGGKMMIESFKKEDSKAATTECATAKAAFSMPLLLSLAVATSIDALATGIIFISTPQLIWIAVGIIAAVSFLFSIAGMCIGVFFGKRFRINVEFIGGLILVAIGLKICIEHLVG